MNCHSIISQKMDFMSKSMKFIYIYAGIFFLSIGISFSQNSSDSTALIKEINKSTDKRTHNLYAGAKVGAIFVVGLELNYILNSKNRQIMYLASSAQSTFVINTVNVGGGIFLGKTNLGVGCRYNRTFRIESEKHSKTGEGWAPEVVWYKAVGPNNKFLVNLHAGTIFTNDGIYPDITFGVFLPLTR